MYSPPDRPLEKRELGLVSVSPSVSVALVSTLATVSAHFCLCRLGLHTCHNISPLPSLSPWSPHLPQCQSTSVSVALVSTLATVSAHFCLCRLGLHICHSVSPLLSVSRWSPHLPQCQSTSVSVALVSTLATVSVHFCFCRVGLHTCHSVSPLLFLSRWSPHLPVSVHFCFCRVGLHTCHSVSPQRPQVFQSLSVRLYRRHHRMKAQSMHGYRQHSQNSCPYLLPLTGVEPESSGEHVSPVTTTTSSRASLS